ncbi:DUF4184 family protein [Streptomyces coffeae]|uniref:DUF4184 family protein n=1 Tax=Streptomyces coffeae TaxID=621382 RepID=A0ABS1NCP7_9ACTN|nr:DUF4184 family protein [Streptomyces coffeae]MBL1097851.1 DUF4184 family protein [Streptomyces coffeae]
MPFTLSHAAAVLPLLRPNGRARGPLIASALVAGALAPDVPYFAATVAGGAIRLGDTTHTILGAMTVDVLFAAGLVGIWWLLREPLLMLAPPGHRARAAALLASGRWRSRSLYRLAGPFWASAAVGAATHVLWDSFTHPGRAGVRLFPWLETYAGGFPLYTWMQYGSSAMALVVIAGFLRRALRTIPTPVPVASDTSSPRIPGQTALAVTAIAGTTLVGAVLRCAQKREFLAHAPTHQLLPTALFGAGGGLLAGLLLYALLVHAVWQLRPSHGRVRREPSTSQGSNTREAAGQHPEGPA